MICRTRNGRALPNVLAASHRISVKECPHSGITTVFRTAGDRGLDDAERNGPLSGAIAGGQRDIVGIEAVRPEGPGSPHMVQDLRDGSHRARIGLQVDRRYGRDDVGLRLVHAHGDVMLGADVVQHVLELGKSTARTDLPVACSFSAMAPR